MKLVVAIVRPEKANDVLEALYRADVRGLSISRVQGHGGETDRVETYRGTRVKMELSEKVRFEVAVSDNFVEPTIQAIAEGGAHGRGRRRQDLRSPPRARGAHPHRRGGLRSPSPRWSEMSGLVLAASGADRLGRHRLDPRWRPRSS